MRDSHPPVDDESLRAAIQAVLPTTPMGELESIKSLPGMIDAAADMLHKAWRAGIDLAVRATDHPRLDAIARLETAVLDQLPSGMMRPVDIVAAATSRIAHAPAVIGPMEIAGLTELSPCWRPLVKALTAHIPVQWSAGPRTVPAWLEDTGVGVSRAPAEAPRFGAVSAATAYHEAIEAMRWVRSLLASGVAASDIAIATASPADYDDHFLALRADANIDLHFVHGVRTVTAREGHRRILNSRFDGYRLAFIPRQICCARQTQADASRDQDRRRRRRCRRQLDLPRGS